MKKRQVRIGVFETNSSSTHSISICSPEEWSKLELGISENENLNESYERYLSEDEFETYSYETTTPGGEKIRLFGYYGYNG